MKARIVTGLVLIAFAIRFATPAYADRVEVKHITQVLANAQNVPEIHLRESYNKDLPTPSSSNSQPYLETINEMDVATLFLQQDPQKGPRADVETAICDCGDLMVPVAGGFPKWPFLFLAGVPLIFIKRGENELPPVTLAPPKPPGLTPNPTGLPPTDTPNPVPEPTSLLLLVTGVCAVGLRLRKSMHRPNRNGENDDA